MAPPLKHRFLGKPPGERSDAAGTLASDIGLSNTSSLIQGLRDRLSVGALSTVRWPRAQMLVELALFAGLMPLVGLLLFPADPLGIDHGFLWAVLGPLLFAARYGVAPGFACAVVACGLFFLIDSNTASVQVVATVFGAVLIGELASNWRQRALRAEAQGAYLKHRLKEFSNEYHVLKLSHGQLEAHLAGQRMSLRGALQKLRPALVTRDASREASEELMAVFAQFCSVQVAGLYLLSSDTVIDPEPLAVLGGMGQLPRFDPLLRLALAERELVSLKIDSEDKVINSDGLLAVAPIVDSAGRVHAVLAVQDMHFMAFQQDNLDKLALLAASIGDRIAHNGRLDEGPAEHFFAEVDTALRFVSSHSVDASLLVARLPKTEQGEIVAEALSSDLRSLDCGWRVPSLQSEEDSLLVAVLMPLTNRASAGEWINRLAETLGSEHDIDLVDQLLSMRCLELNSRTTRRQCLDFIIDKGQGEGNLHEAPRVA